MTVQPPKPAAEYLTPVPWVVVTWQWRQTGPGGAVVHKKTEGALIFDSYSAFREWWDAQLLAGNEGYKYTVFCGDPTFGGASRDEFEHANAHVMEAVL